MRTKQKGRENYIVYKITNQINGRFYIGITMRPLRERMQGHKYHVKRGGRQSMLTKAMKKYGYDAFSIEIIDTASGADEANEKEMYYIDQLKPHYNLTKGGEGVSGFSQPKTKEQKRKLSEAAKKAWAIPETRLLMTLACSSGQLGKGPLPHRDKFARARADYWTPDRVKKRAGFNSLCQARLYKIIAPDGSRHEVSDIKSFCSKYGLNIKMLQQTAPGQKRKNVTHKGFYLLEPPFRQFASIADVAKYLKISRAATARMRNKNPIMFSGVVDSMQSLGLIPEGTAAFPAPMEI